MRRSALNFLVDVISLVVMFGLIATGLIVKYILPSGSAGRGGGAAQSVWGLGRHGWGDVHFWLAAGIIALLIVHVALHWTWTCALVRRSIAPNKPPPPQLAPWRRHLYGVGFLTSIAFLFAAFTWLAWTNVETTRGERPRATWVERHNDEPAQQDESVAAHDAGRDVHVRGSMTLAEIEAETGVTLAELADELGLPPDVDENERLGRLARRYGFSVSEVRHRLREANTVAPGSAHSPAHRERENPGQRVDSPTAVVPQCGAERDSHKRR